MSASAVQGGHNKSLSKWDTSSLPCGQSCWQKSLHCHLAHSIVQHVHRLPCHTCPVHAVREWSMLWEGSVSSLDNVSGLLICFDFSLWTGNRVYTEYCVVCGCWGRIGTTWQIRLNLCFLRPIQVHNPHSRSFGSAVFEQFTSDCRRACWSMPFPLKIAPSHGGSVPPSNTWFLSLVYPTEHPKWHLDRFSRFCTAHCIKSLYFTMGAPPPSKLPLPVEGCGPLSNTWFLGPNPVLNSNEISISWADFALLWQTDRQTMLLGW